MTLYVVQNENQEIEFHDESDAISYANAHDLDAPTTRYKITPDLKSANMSNGLTREQSDSMFDQYVDVMVLINANELEDGVTLLEGKTPSDFITQDIIDSWIDILESYL